MSSSSNTNPNPTGSRRHMRKHEEDDGFRDLEEVVDDDAPAGSMAAAARMSPSTSSSLAPYVRPRTVASAGAEAAEAAAIAAGAASSMYSDTFLSSPRSRTTRGPSPSSSSSSSSSSAHTHHSATGTTTEAPDSDKVDVIHAVRDHTVHHTTQPLSPDQRRKLRSVRGLGHLEEDEDENDLLIHSKMYKSMASSSATSELFPEMDNRFSLAGLDLPNDEFVMELHANPIFRDGVLLEMSQENLPAAAVAAANTEAVNSQSTAVSWAFQAASTAAEAAAEATVQEDPIQEEEGEELVPITKKSKKKRQIKEDDEEQNEEEATTITKKQRGLGTGSYDPTGRSKRIKQLARRKQLFMLYAQALDAELKAKKQISIPEILEIVKKGTTVALTQEKKKNQKNQNNKKLKKHKKKLLAQSPPQQPAAVSQQTDEERNLARVLGRMRIH